MSTNEAIYEFEKVLAVADYNDTKYIDLLHTAIKALKHVDAIRQIVVYDNLGEYCTTGKWYDCGSLSCRCNRCGCKNDRESLYCPNCGSKNG